MAMYEFQGDDFLDEAEINWREHDRMLRDMETEIDDGTDDAWLELFDEYDRDLQAALDADLEAMIRTHFQVPNNARVSQ